jgi:hypothetical protein
VRLSSDAAGAEANQGCTCEKLSTSCLGKGEDCVFCCCCRLTTAATLAALGGFSNVDVTFSLCRGKVCCMFEEQRALMGLENVWTCKGHLRVPALSIQVPPSATSLSCRSAHER